MHCQHCHQKMSKMRTIIFFIASITCFACIEKNRIHVLVEEIFLSEYVSSHLKNIDKDLKFEVVDVHNILNEDSALQIGRHRTVVRRDQDILEKIKRITFLNENENLLLLSKKDLSNDEFEIFIYHPNSGLIITNRIKVKNQRNYEIIDQELGDI